jgi:hypothetical protein
MFKIIAPQLWWRLNINDRRYFGWRIMRLSLLDERGDKFQRKEFNSNYFEWRNRWIHKSALWKFKRISSRKPK